MPHYPPWLDELLFDVQPTERVVMAKSLEHHLEALLRWNKRINLTHVNNMPDAWDFHIQDSLQLRAHLRGERIADMGSGGGFPGLPLAITCPTQNFDLIEPRRKRVSFLTTTVRSIGLKNCKAIETRSEHHPSEPYDTVVSRATFSELKTLSSCAAWLKNDAYLLAMRTADTPMGEGPKGQVLLTYSIQGRLRELRSFSKKELLEAQ